MKLDFTITFTEYERCKDKTSNRIIQELNPNTQQIKTFKAQFKLLPISNFPPYIYVFPFKTGNQSDAASKCLIGLHNS